MHGNLFQDLPKQLENELFSTITDASGVKIERILSQGQCSEPGFWYQQDQHEWVIVLQGAAILRFDDDPKTQLKTTQPETTQSKETRPKEMRLGPGDYLLIPAGERHRVDWTDPEQLTIWLAVFFDDSP
ncbi:hypothetical protein [Aliagarivorans marinus]|uniref:hypothetical protein n=1 Tax=Aliagarivorans marinus TaxID=561965 RepID=UPI0004029B63|nr:hypothetical protein [Aliagarivorans marinus]